MRYRPLILIACSLDRKGIEFDDLSVSLSLHYPRAIRAAGGMPLLLPTLDDAAYVREAVGRADGILLTGGDDVDPRRYRRKLPAALDRKVQRELPLRERFEFRLLREIFLQPRPLLCICRGHQLLNVALGGTLVADIPAERPGTLNHGQTGRSGVTVHEVALAAGSLLHRATGRRRLGTNSTHHQAVAKVAKPLRITAVTKDGIIEGLEWGAEDPPPLPWLAAVQFHPERLFERHAAHFGLFRSFVRACHRHRRSQV